MVPTVPTADLMRERRCIDFDPVESMAFNFLSLPQAERAEEPAPIDGEERRGYGSFKTSKTSNKSIAAEFPADAKHGRP